uniref:Protein pelota homolog n=1 Tax=Chrysotila carterae TaxID=13221 RepID=A0A7S4ESU8_CHRCT
MRLLGTTGEAFSSKGADSGEAKMRPDEPEDLWHAYNLIVRGDVVSASTFRKLKTESSTGSVDSTRVRVTVAVEVRSVDFDPEGGELRLNGYVRSEHDGIRLGSHHTLELEVGRPFTLRKEAWDSVSLARLHEATADAVATADIAAVLVAHGTALLCLLSAGMTIVRARIDVHIPKKVSAAMAAASAKASDKWHETLLQAVVRHIDFERVRVVLLAGPGFVKEGVYEFLFREAAKRGYKQLLTSRPKWLLCHAASAYKHALKEVLADPAVAARVADTRAAAEVRALSAFFSTLAETPERVTYGPKHVEIALANGALASLLITDTLFRANSIAKRSRYVAMVEAARALGSQVHVFSSLHVSGEQLAQLSGVAAMLRFPLPIELDDDDDHDDDGNEDSNDKGGTEGDEANADGASRSPDRKRSDNTTAR